MHRKLALLASGLIIISSSSLHSRVIRIPADYATIQAGISSSASGDTVLVSPGTYYEHGITFQGKAILVTGSAPTDSSIVAATVVDGSSLGLVFLFNSGEDSSSVLSGFAITDGWAASGGAIFCDGASPVISNNIITGNLASNAGGAIHCANSSAIISDNIIADNSASAVGGGIYCYFDSPTISGNVISSNSTGGRGGGIACEWSSPSIVRNSIVGNSVVEYGAGISCFMSSGTIADNMIDGNTTDVDGGGGGIYCYSSSPVIHNNAVKDNWAGIWGGGIYCFSEPSPTITGNVIMQNSANYSGGGGINCLESSPIISGNTLFKNSADNSSGGGITLYSSSATVMNNTLVGNTTDFWGGGIFCWDAISPTISDNILVRNSSQGVGGGISCYNSTVPTISNNTIYDNSAIDQGGGISSNASTVTVSGTIFYGNTAALGNELSVTGAPSTLSISYCDVQGGQGQANVDGGCTLNWGTGMINADPLFANGDYELQAASPCVDAGDPSILDSCQPPGLGGTGSDIGAYGGADNCWSPELGIDLVLFPGTPASVVRGNFFSFHAIIINNTSSTTSGDYWISVSMPNQTQFLVPPGILNTDNPISGPVPALSATVIAQEIFVPSNVDTLTYGVVGRVGLHQATVIDEESFDLTVTQ